MKSIKSPTNICIISTLVISMLVGYFTNGVPATTKCHELTKSQAVIFLDQPDHDKISDISLSEFEEVPIVVSFEIDQAVNFANGVYPNVSKGLIYSVMYHESRYQPNVSNGSCVGLMQVSTKWHKTRAEKLGVLDFYDIYGNVMIGTDYLSELIDIYKSEYLALMVYHGEANAVEKFNNGGTSWYAESVLSMAYSFGGD